VKKSIFDNEDIQSSLSSLLSNMTKV